jgi:uncharacterized DUF497 family protein
MPWIDVIWTEENEAHVAEHGFSRADVQCVLRHRMSTITSRSSRRPIAVGDTPDGRRIAVVYEQIDAISVYPITAYLVED